jgi:hypothetical protein
MKVVPLSKEEVAGLQKQLSNLTTQIRNHKGSPVQLAGLRGKRLGVSRKLYDETARLRNELLKPSLVLAEIRKTTPLSPEADHAIQLAVELFHSVSIDDMEYVNRRVGYQTN